MPQNGLPPVPGLRHWVALDAYAMRFEFVIGDNGIVKVVQVEEKLTCPIPIDLELLRAFRAVLLDADCTPANKRDAFRDIIKTLAVPDRQADSSVETYSWETYPPPGWGDNQVGVR